MTTVKPLSGIICPVITPLSSPDRLDTQALERLLDRLADGGVAGIFILGTTGEGTSLGLGLRREVIERTCRHIGGRVPILAGVTDTAYEHSLEIARLAAREGAFAMVATAPFAIDHDQSDLRAYLQRLVTECPLPLVLYHKPPLTLTSISRETVAWATDQPNIIGVKDSSGDFSVFEAFLEESRGRRDWGVYVGADTLLAEAVKRGAHGGVSGGANLAPELFVGLYNAVRTGDAARIEALNAKVRELVSTLFAPEPHPIEVIKVIKSTLACLGVCRDVMTEPFQSLRPQKREEVRRKWESLAF